MKDLRFKRKYFEMIQSGKKTLECRVNYPSLRSIKDSDKVKFFWEHLSVIVEIVGVRKYSGFAKMLNKEKTEKLAPGMSKEQALVEYEAIYPSWKVKQNNGVVVFEIKIVGK
ncbi:MAG: ASCH domain-containing protein [bacterium]